MDVDKLRKWSDNDRRRMYEQLDKMRIYPPGNLIEQLEFYEEVEAVLTLLEASDKPRELLLEAWLLVDYVTTYLLRDAFGLPLRLEEPLKLLPSEFEGKLILIRRLQKHEAKVFPNPKSYTAYELHPDFHQLLMEDKDLYKRLLELAVSFEKDRRPNETLVLMRNDFEKSRYVTEWWFKHVSTLDAEWFKTCRRLNEARNIAAHKLKMTGPEIFTFFDVADLREFKDVLKKTIKDILFKPGT